MKTQLANQILAEFPRGTYQEICIDCGEKFFGRKNAMLCLACSEKNDEWWDALTDEQQLAHMQAMIGGLNAIKTTADSKPK